MSLRDHLIARIEADGPMTVATYMHECLLNPKYGYYTTRDPLGAAGDFITAPEISQMFGELLGLSLAQSWLDQGSPTPFTLAELGPGRGTLMADFLRATKSVPGFHAAAQIVLIEASPTLKTAQQQALSAYQVHWQDTVSTLPDQPLWLIANEFFDALPIRQFLREGKGWREKCIGLQQGELAYGLGPLTQQSALDHRLEDTNDGDLVEVCEAATPITAEISKRIAQYGGAALIIDYGDWHALGDTFQALRNHQSTDPLADPGQADLTAHVDFEVIAQAANASACKYSRVTPQGVFLERLGITARAQTLATSLSGATLDTLTAAHQRLTHPHEMGNLFKVIGLYPNQAAPPPGLNA